MSLPVLETIEGLNDHKQEQNTSTALNSVMQASPYPESASINAALYRADQRRARKPERRESSFVNTIVGRRGGLRPILNKVEAETMCSLVCHCWPANIWELQNCIARGVILSNDGIFEPGPLESHERLEPEIANSEQRSGNVDPNHRTITIAEKVT